MRDERVLRQFADLRRYWPDATIKRGVNGDHVVRIPDVILDGFLEPSTWVEITVPIGFPMACPADFDTAGLHLKSGGTPAYVWICEDGHLNWQHRVMAWRPNDDTIMTYIRTVLRRLNGHPTVLRAALAARAPEAQP